MKRSMRIWFTIATIIVVGCTSGNEDNDNDSRQLTGGNGTQGNGGSGGDDTGTVTGAGTTSVDPSGVVGGRTSPVSTCGDGIVDQKEDCDDGQNGDDEDGCTDICTFTCSNDADCSTNDMCAGEGSCDLTTHTCQPGIPLADGEKCGLGMACIKGICTNINCESSEDCISDCDPLASCNPATGVCEPGSPIADDTLCDNGDGYCKGSVCVSNTCGDGIAEPNEECDLGDENGTADSGCTERCTLFVCGNGVREGNEQCDDGNTRNMDACDKHCKLELVYRVTRIVLTTEPADEICEFSDSVNQGNAMSKNFPDDPTILEMIREQMVAAFDSGEANSLFYVSGLDDPSANTEDSSISFGQLQAVLGAPWGSQDALDFPVYADLGSLDDNYNPKNNIPMELVREGDVTLFRTAHPAAMINETPQGNFSVYRTMSVIELDPQRSPIPDPGGIDISDVSVPETMGQPDSVDAHGFICGAIPASSMDGNPLPALFADMCLEDYDGCLEGEDPLLGECDSIRKVMENGCTSFLGIPLVTGMGQPDADIDGDGENEGYSTVVRYSAKRVRLIGIDVAPPIDVGCTCGCICENCNETFSCEGVDCMLDCDSPCTERCANDAACGAFVESMRQCRDSV